MRTLRPLFLVCFFLACCHAHAQWRPRVQARGAELRVNDVLILRTRTTVGGIQPGERARLSAERLRELTEVGLEPREIRVDTETETRYRMEKRTVTKMVEKTVTRRIRKKRRRVKIEVPVQVRETVRVAYEIETEARLIARDKVLATASPMEAKAAAQLKPSLLAEGWASTLRRALAIPGIALSKESTIIPWMDKRTLKFSGAARGAVTVLRQSGPGSPIETIVDMKQNTVTLIGKSIGREVLTLVRGGATARLTVAVQPYAATLRTPQPVMLTGNGIAPEKVSRLVLASFRAAIQPLVGASVRLETELGAVPPPAIGKSLSVPITFTVSGEEMLPVRQSVKVPVISRPVPKMETNALLFSNNPERIKESQTLYVARLTMGTARLLYHHQNGCGQNLWFVAELLNDSDEPVRIQVLGTDAGPVRDTVWVGYRAASDFMSAFSSDSGMILEIPARSRVGFQAVRLPVELTISGLFELRLLSGSAPLVRVGADKPGDPFTLGETLRPYPLTEAFQAQMRDVDRQSSHVYPKPSISLVSRHSVGGRWGVFSIGRAPITGAGNQALEGNYGVFYDVALNLENPTTSATDVRVFFEPAGGLAGGVFLIDGKRVEIPRTNMPTQTLLGTFRLGPGARLTVPIRTLPLSGSNYPVNLWVK